MRCPYCGAVEDHVIDSRPTYDGKAIRRRRECLSCDRRYTTFERVEDRPLMVIKKDGRREPFNSDKILQSMMVACRKRHVSMKVLEEAVDEIEREIYNRMEPEISTIDIGRMAMEKLLHIDKVAYVRFASVYQEFQDPQQFGEVVTMLAKTSKKRATKT